MFNLKLGLALETDSLTQELGGSDVIHTPRIPAPSFLSHYAPGCRRKALDSKKKAPPWFSLYSHGLVGSG